MTMKERREFEVAQDSSQFRSSNLRITDTIRSTEVHGPHQSTASIYKQSPTTLFGATRRILVSWSLKRTVVFANHMDRVSFSKKETVQELTPYFPTVLVV
jgi:hypothetical protein